MIVRHTLSNWISSFIGVAAVAVVVTYGCAIWSELDASGYLAFRKEDTTSNSYPSRDRTQEPVLTESQHHELPTIPAAMRHRFADRYMNDAK